MRKCIFPQNQPGADVDLHVIANKSNEKLHDGNMNFTQGQPEVSSFSVQDQEHPETKCEQLTVLTNSPEDLRTEEEIAVL